MQINKKKAAIIAAAVILIASAATTVYAFHPGPRNNRFPDAEINPSTIQQVNFKLYPVPSHSSFLDEYNYEFSIKSQEGLKTVIACLKDLSTVSEHEFETVQENSSPYDLTYTFKDGSQKYYKHSFPSISDTKSFNRVFQLDEAKKQYLKIFSAKPADISKIEIRDLNETTKVLITEKNKITFLLESAQNHALKEDPYKADCTIDKNLIGRALFYNCKKKIIYFLPLSSKASHYNEIRNFISAG